MGRLLYDLRGCCYFSDVVCFNFTLHEGNRAAHQLASMAVVTILLWFCLKMTRKVSGVVAEIVLLFLLTDYFLCYHLKKEKKKKKLTFKVFLVYFLTI